MIPYRSKPVIDAKLLYILQGMFKSKAMFHLSPEQCDQIWLFLKGLGEKYSFKSRPTKFYRLLKYVSFEAKTDVAAFRKIGQLFFLTFGHTCPKKEVAVELNGHHKKLKNVSILHLKGHNILILRSFLQNCMG